MSRPRLNPKEVMATMSLRLSAAQRDCLSRMGGAAWLRKKLDAELRKELRPSRSL